MGISNYIKGVRVNKPRENCFSGGEVSVFSGNEVRTVSLFLVLSRLARVWQLLVAIPHIICPKFNKSNSNK